MKLFIDDIRDPIQDDFIVLRNYAEAVGLMRQKGCPNFISFDHDLGTADDLTGYDIAKWIVNRDIDMNGAFIPHDFDYVVHSANPVGRDNIVGLLNNYLEVRDV